MQKAPPTPTTAGSLGALAAQVLLILMVWRYQNRPPNGQRVRSKNKWKTQQKQTHELSNNSNWLLAACLAHLGGPLWQLVAHDLLTYCVWCCWCWLWWIEYRSNCWLAGWPAGCGCCYLAWKYFKYFSNSRLAWMNWFSIMAWPGNLGAWKCISCHKWLSQSDHKCQNRALRTLWLSVVSVLVLNLDSI